MAKDFGYGTQKGAPGSPAFSVLPTPTAINKLTLNCQQLWPWLGAGPPGTRPHYSPKVAKVSPMGAANKL